MPGTATILITGKDGQVGYALGPVLAPLGRVAALGRAECDLADPRSLAQAVRTIRPQIIVNAAAYTAVDKAESESDLATAVNVAGPGRLAELAKEVGATLIHYSTDYVFDGKKQVPYREDDPTNPLSVYGRTKRDGEVAVRAALPESLILRTSWVFSDRGTNFLKTMLRLGGERDALNIVADQFGTPTSAVLIAKVTAVLVMAILGKRNAIPYGTYHLTASGETSWYCYSRFLIAEARRLGLRIRVAEDAIRPIPASAYPAAAVRPTNSRLDTAKLRENFGIDLPPWQDGVRTILETLARS